jgi:hypothetical protein
MVMSEFNGARLKKNDRDRLADRVKVLPQHLPAPLESRHTVYNYHGRIYQGYHLGYHFWTCLVIIIVEFALGMLLKGSLWSKCASECEMHGIGI